MARNSTPRFPLDAITGYNHCELARHTGFAVRSIQRWTRDGIPLWSADKLAISLGVHPANIWPDWTTTPPSHVNDQTRVAA
jgi:hypothetical protein